MSGQVVFILAMVFLAWHVITQIVQAIARKQQQERAAEVARQRQQGHVTLETPGREGRSVGGSPAGRSRLDELAARRQAQLEELRRRRGGQQPRSGEARSAEVRTGGQGTMTMPPPQQPRRMPPPPVPSPPDPVRSGPRPQQRSTIGDGASARQTAQRQAREAMQRRLEQQARLQQQQREAARLQVEAEAVKARRRAEARAEKQIISPYALRTTPKLSIVRQMLTEPDMLRHAIVLKEIIDRPVSLRPEDALPGSTPSG